MQHAVLPLTVRLMNVGQDQLMHFVAVQQWCVQAHADGGKWLLCQTATVMCDIFVKSASKPAMAHAFKPALTPE